jgi:transposase
MEDTPLTLSTSGHLTPGWRPGKESMIMGDSRRRWSPEFKRDAVALVRSSGRSISDVARELGCGESSLGYWLARDRAARVAADPERFAAEQAESDEVKRLRRRVAELEVEREILKRSMAWWVKESTS